MIHPMNSPNSFIIGWEQPISLNIDDNWKVAVLEIKHASRQMMGVNFWTLDEPHSSQYFYTTIELKSNGSPLFYLTKHHGVDRVIHENKAYYLPSIEVYNESLVIKNKFKFIIGVDDKDDIKNLGLSKGNTTATFNEKTNEYQIVLNNYSKKPFKTKSAWIYFIFYKVTKEMNLTLPHSIRPWNDIKEILDELNKIFKPSIGRFEIDKTMY